MSAFTSMDAEEVLFVVVWADFRVLAWKLSSIFPSDGFSRGSFEQLFKLHQDLVAKN